MRCTQLLALVALNQKKDCQDPGSACVCFVLQNAVFLNVTTSSGCVCVMSVIEVKTQEQKMRVCYFHSASEKKSTKTLITFDFDPKLLSQVYNI